MLKQQTENLQKQQAEIKGEVQKINLQTEAEGGVLVRQHGQGAHVVAGDQVAIISGGGSRQSLYNQSLKNKVYYSNCLNRMTFCLILFHSQKIFGKFAEK